MKNIKIFAFLAIFLLSAFVSSAWATDVTLTYKIDVQGTILNPVANIYDATNRRVASWDHGIKTLWPANEGHTMDDDYGITFTPNQELDKTGKNENNKSTSTTAFRTEKETFFTVSVGKEGFYLKSVTFKEDDVEKASSSNIVPNSTSISVRVPGGKFFNYITVVLTADAYTVSVPKNIIISDAFATINRVKYYKSGETVKLTAKENELIEKITGVTASDKNVTMNLAADRKSATFTMPSENVTFTAEFLSIAEVHTVSVPEDLTISDALATIDSVKYYKSGETVKLTAKENELIEKITGVTASDKNVTMNLATDRKSATFMMPSENVEISAEIFKIWGNGDGSENNPFTISRSLELDSLAKRVNAGNDYSGKYFKLTADIIYTYEGSEQENNYTAIGNEEHPFNGKFNGNGHTISGIRIYKPNDNGLGLFGYLGEGAVIENVKLEDVVITGKTYVGGIAGRNYGSVTSCTSSVTLTGSGNYHGGIVGFNRGTVSGNTSSATLIGSGNSHGGIVGFNIDGTVSKNIVKNVMLSAVSSYGTVVGRNGNTPLSNNFYTACTVNGVKNATNVGTGGGDVTENNGAVSIHSVTLGEGVSVVIPEKPIYTDDNLHNYYKAGETLALEINFAGEKKTATFKMSNRDVEIVATASELHTVSVPEGLDISEPYFTIDEIKYYKHGETYTLKLATTNVNEVIDEITGVTGSNDEVSVTIADDKRSATFTMPNENVKISATIFKIWGDGDGTKDRPYTISSSLELDSLAERVNAGNDFENTYFKVIADIAYTYEGSKQETNYTAIGMLDWFKGYFNGNGHTISGIHIYRPEDDCLGLFGYIGSGAVIENVMLEDVVIVGKGYVGGIVGHNRGMVSGNFAKNVTVSAEYSYGTVIGKNTSSAVLSNNFYTACTVNSVKNASNVGVGSEESSSDVTESNGAVAVSITAPVAANLVYNKSSQNLVTAGMTNFGTLLYSLDGESFSAEIPTAVEAQSYTVYYRVDRDNGSVVDPQTIEVSIAPKSVASESVVTTATWEKAGSEYIPNIVVKDGEMTLQENVDYTVEVSVVNGYVNAVVNGLGNYTESVLTNISEVHTVSVPEGFVISDAYTTINMVKYYKPGETYTLTESNTNDIIDEITGVTASIASDRKSATFMMPSEDVEISAKIFKIWGDGDGSKDHPYTISRSLELDSLAKRVNAGNNFENTYFEVIADIAYTYEGSEQENNYTAIGNNNRRFEGLFNGNDYTISGIRIYKPNNDGQGLFGYLGKGGVIENVKLDDVVITGKSYVGGIVGYSIGMVLGCTSSATLVGSGDVHGGIVGSNEGTVSGCTSSATLAGSGEVHGGIVGYNFWGTVSGNTSSAMLTGSGDEHGGIVGNDYSYSGSVSNNFAKNVTISDGSYHGAVIGINSNGSEQLNNFYTACTVNGVENATNVGVGGKESSSDVTENNGAVAVSFTEPAAIENLVYNNSAQELVTAGEINFGTLLYSLDGESFSAEIPTAVEAQSYTVYYKVDSDNGSVVDPQTIKVSIAPVEVLVSDAVRFIDDLNGKRVEINAEYSGKEPICVPDAVAVDFVEVKRNLVPLTPATIVLPVQLPEGTTFNARFYYLKEVKQVGCSWNAVMKYIGSNNLPEPNRPYAVILNDGEDKLEFDLHGEQATVRTAKIADNWDLSNKWQFVGTYSYKVWEEGNDEIGLVYGFAGSNEDGIARGEFGRVKAGAYAVPMRSYLKKRDKDVRVTGCAQGIRANGAAYSAVFSNTDIIGVEFIDEEEQTTAIGRMNTRTGEFKIDRWYDLKGRKVNNVNRAAKGAYYGKKVFKK